MSLEPNVTDVALIIEGGGMRACVTAGVFVTMIENNINFSQVYGISAGTSHAADYVSRDIPRTKQAFVDLVNDPDFGGLGSLLRGKGYFNAEHLYEGIADDLEGTDEAMAFDWQTFCANPADIHVEAFNIETGETVVWTKADMPTVRDMMLRIRASSSLPFFMPNTVIDGHIYADGGLGSSWGIPLDTARNEGFERFFIVRTRERGYRKKQVSGILSALARIAWHKKPLVAKRMLERWQPYNALCDEIDRLEREGKAFVFYPENVTANSRTRDFDVLQENYDRGYAQAQTQLAQWKEFLRLS